MSESIVHHIRTLVSSFQVESTVQVESVVQVELDHQLDGLDESVFFLVPVLCRKNKSVPSCLIFPSECHSSRLHDGL